MRRLTVTLPLPLILIGAAAVAGWWPFWSAEFALGLVNVLVPVSFVAIGVVLVDDPAQRPNGVLMLVAAPLYLSTWWWHWPSEWQAGPLPLFGFVFGYLWFVSGGLVLARYPAVKLSRRYERMMFLTMAVWIVGTRTATVLTSEPGWNGYGPRVWWPGPWPAPDLFPVLRTVSRIGLVIVVAGAFAVLLLALRRSRGLERVDSTPVLAAACAVSVCGGAYLIARALDLPVGLVDALRSATGVASLITPVAFLITVLRRRLARAAVADLVLRLSGAPTVEGVQEAIRFTLHDPYARVLFRLSGPDATGYADAHGSPAYPRADGDRWAVPVHTGNGAELALLELDPVLRRHPHLVRSVVTAGGLALENGRLHAEVAAQLAEVRASRARIVQEGMAERRRIERDLHDGAQQSLLAATTSLAAAQLLNAGSDDAAEAIDRARAELAAARRELRDLARGIHPAVLTQSGLGPAVEDVAERLGLSLHLAVRDPRLPPAVETTCYFVVAEALMNVVRHAGTSDVWVDIDNEAGATVVRIRDDGTGGAEPSAGSGLSGLDDRVRALHGDLTVHSPPGGGTTLTVHVPCG